MQNTPRGKRNIGNLTIEPYELGVTPSKFDLAVFIIERGEEVIASWLYSTDLFEASTVRRMAAQYERLLRHAVAAPDTRVSALEMLSDEEKAAQEQDAQQRKKSQLKKFLTAEPKAVSLSEAQAASKE
jgi:non-ribosomal peptide synthetase component F